MQPKPDLVLGEGFEGPITREQAETFVGRYVVISYEIHPEEHRLLVSELHDAEYTGYIPPPVGGMAGVLVEITEDEQPDLVVDWGMGVRLDKVTSISLEVPDGDENILDYYALVVRGIWRGYRDQMTENRRLHAIINHQRRALREARNHPGRVQRADADEASTQGQEGPREKA